MCEAKNTVPGLSGGFNGLDPEVIRPTLQIRRLYLGFSRSLRASSETAIDPVSMT